MNSSAPWEDSTPLTLWLTDFWTRLSSLGEVDDFSITFVDFTLVPLNMAPQINPLATVSFKGSTSPALLSTHLRVMVNLRPKIYIYIFFYLKKKYPKVTTTNLSSWFDIFESAIISMVFSTVLILHTFMHNLAFIGGPGYHMLCLINLSYLLITKRSQKTPLFWNIIIPTPKIK